MLPRTAGAQYHWISEFAPPNCQKQLSYVVGWLGVLGWQIGVTVGAFVSGTLLQGLLILSYPNYHSERWHGTLIAMLITFITASFNIFFAKWLPFVEDIVLFLHFAAWLAMLVPLWVLAPKANHSEVWNSFVDAGWRNSESSFERTGYMCTDLSLRSWCCLFGRDDNERRGFRWLGCPCSYGRGTERCPKTPSPSHVWYDAGQRRHGLLCAHVSIFVIEGI